MNNLFEKVWVIIKNYEANSDMSKIYKQMTTDLYTAKLCRMS